MEFQQCLTSDFIKQFTNQNDLSKVEELSLSSMNLTELCRDSLHHLSALKWLDLSDNQLCDFPSVHLPSLESLDISNNHFRDIKFVQNFPNLKQLYITGNELEESDKYIAVVLCKDLLQINKGRNLNRAALEVHRKNLVEVITPLWENHQMYTTDLSHESLKKFKDTWPKLPGPPSLRGYIKFLAEEILKGLVLKAKDLKANGKPAIVKSPAVVSKKTSPPKKKRKIDSENKICTNLPGADRFEAIHCLRCHSGELGQDDTETKVWCVVAEPEYDGCSGSLVASCGGPCVCVIDCKSGRITHRYREDNEEFFSLAWSVFVTDEQQTERHLILAAGCRSGGIRLIQPLHNYCYQRLSQHKDSVNSLTFHPAFPTILFSGARNIKVWDIGIPEPPKYKSNCRMLKTLQLPRTGQPNDVLQLSVTQNGRRLVAGCWEGCYMWSIPTDPTESQPWAHRTQPHMQVHLGMELTDTYDAIAQLGSSGYATKSAEEGIIKVWSTKDLESARDPNAVKATAQLQWQNEQEYYLPISSSEDGELLLASGVNGKIWLYNTSNILPALDETPDNIIFPKVLKPSQVLEWPLEHAGSDEPPTVNSATITSDNKYIVTGTSNNLITVWSRL